MKAGLPVSCTHFNTPNIVKLHNSCRTANQSILGFWNLVCRHGNTARAS